MRTLLILLGIGILAQPVAAESTPTLSLEAYLEQVRTRHEGVQGNLEASQAAQERSSEASLLFAPSLFANAQWASDAKMSTTPGFLYDKINNNSYTLGVAQQTTFGLQARVSWNVNYTSIVNPMAVGATGATAYPFPPYYDSRPSIELSQPLWGNGFGRGVRATRDLLEAQALASSYASRFKARASLVEAETHYWRLALARQSVALSKDALERARKIHDWNNRRVQLHLTDRTDALQAQALLEVRRLELQGAQDELRDLSRTFNAARGQDSDEVTEALADFDPRTADEMIARIKVPERAAFRDDVKAAQQAERATAANATLSGEKNLPSLELYGQYALNGRKDSFTGSLSDPFSANRPTQAIGLRFSVPLNLGTLAEARQGWARERAAAEKNLARTLFEQENSWKSLNAKFTEAKRRLELARSLERAQETKLSHERTRLQQGRTVTYQVLAFEQDYAQAQLARIRSQADVLMILAQLKLFGENL